MSRKVEAEDAKIGHVYKIRGWGGVFVCTGQNQFLRLGTGHKVNVYDEKVKTLTVTALY